jgi:hypothetical protein
MDCFSSATFLDIAEGNEIPLTKVPQMQISHQNWMPKCTDCPTGRTAVVVPAWHEAYSAQRLYLLETRSLQNFVASSSLSLSSTSPPPSHSCHVSVSTILSLIHLSFSILYPFVLRIVTIIPLDFCCDLCYRFVQASQAANARGRIRVRVEKSPANHSVCERHFYGVTLDICNS